MRWDDYQPFDPGIDRPLDQLSRAEAEAHFARVMAARAERVAALGALCRANGVSLADTPEDLAALCAWFVASIETDPAQPTRVAPRWTGVIVDVAIFLGETLRARHPHLQWTLYTAVKKAHGYQRPVLTGFRGAGDPHYYVDVAHMVALYGQLVVGGRTVKEDYFGYLLDGASRVA